MTHLPLRSTLAVLLLSSLVACGDDKDDAPKDSGSPGVGDGSAAAPVENKEKKISEVTQDEAVKLCRWYIEQLTSVPYTEQQWCNEEGLELSTSAVECEEIAQECVGSGEFADWQQDSAEEREELLAACDAVSAEDGRDCDLSVAEYVACIEAFRARDDRAVGQLACTLAEDGAWDSFNQEEPSECEVLSEKCPNFFGFRPDVPSIELFDCGDGQRIAAEWACDEVSDCENGRDEEDC